MSDAKPPKGAPATPQPRPPSGPEVLHAPWRDAYLQSLSAQEAQRPRDEPDAQASVPRLDEPEAQARESSSLRREPEARAKDSSPRSPSSCFLSDYWRAPDRDIENHIIARVGDGLTAGMILLNKYPYANGHLLIALGDPRPTLRDYTGGQRAALWRLVDLGAELLELALEPQGLNIGINQGRAAGAGVPEHLHAHIVPRWQGDVNFMTTIANVRVNPSALETNTTRLREAWSRMHSPARE